MCYFVILLIAGSTFFGCNETNDSKSISGTTKQGLFKDAGTFSFSSNLGNFTANGVFDTLMISSNAAGAFKYTQGTHSVIVVFAYNVASPLNAQIVWAGVIDTLNTTSTGSYSFAQIGTKIGIFGYFPNIADTSANSTFYLLTSGSMNVAALTATALSGTFSGNGVSVFDSTKTIAVTNGSYNTPIVEQYFSLDDGNVAVIQQRIKAEIKKHLQF